MLLQKVSSVSIPNTHPRSLIEILISCTLSEQQIQLQILYFPNIHHFPSLTMPIHRHWLLFLHLCSSKMNSKYEEENMIYSTWLVFFFSFFLPLFHLHLLAGHDLSIVLSFSLSTHSCFASLSFCFLTTSLVIYIFFILFLAFYFLVSVSFNCPFQWKLSSNTLLYFFVYFKLNSNDPPK